jgi:dihydrofolate reductase
VERGGTRLRGGVATPTEVGSVALAEVRRPNATLVEDDLEAVIGGLKARLDGEIEIAGPELAGSLTDLGLIDEYRLYFRPVVLGRGKPFFARRRPPLRLVATDPVGEDAIRLTYIPA